MQVARIIGVYPVDAPEPCHLCELEVPAGTPEIDFSDITQPVAGQERSNWQVPYDERLISSGATSNVFAFFFHYLDLNEPLLSPFGLLPLPAPTYLPSRLQSIEYEVPC